MTLASVRPPLSPLSPAALAAARPLAIAHLSSRPPAQTARPTARAASRRRTTTAASTSCTVQAPHQKIPLLRETLDLLMQPANQHVLLNIDVKVDNDPERLFTIMKSIISSYADFETKLAPRLRASLPLSLSHLPPAVLELTLRPLSSRAVLGLWHPKYVEPAQRLLPDVRRAHIGMSPALARKYFWDACCTFSMSFASMVNSEGASFRDECRKAGKEITVWCVDARSLSGSVCSRRSS